MHGFRAVRVPTPKNVIRPDISADGVLAPSPAAYTPELIHRAASTKHELYVVKIPEIVRRPKDDEYNSSKKLSKGVGKKKTRLSWGGRYDRRHVGDRDEELQMSKNLLGEIL